ncbi:MAG: hypothetical protein U5N86_08140 [Planctomycetota bacterium]|nr:hypothetical protein [Planctomycetota bacterium]
MDDRYENNKVSLAQEFLAKDEGIVEGIQMFVESAPWIVASRAAPRAVRRSRTGQHGRQRASQVS